jgi:bacterial/archaeal transporter family-2 protein
MLSRTLIFLMVALGGVGLALQMAFNSRLRVSTGSPVLTTLISVAVTLACLTIVWAAGGAANRGSIPSFVSLPWWAWIGGAFAAYYLLASLIAIPHLGVAVVFALVISGQMLAALLLDHTGAFGLPQITASTTRLVGAVMLVLGAVLIQRT